MWKCCKVRNMYIYLYWSGQEYRHARYWNVEIKIHQCRRAWIGGPLCATAHTTLESWLLRLAGWSTVSGVGWRWQVEYVSEGDHCHNHEVMGLSYYLSRKRSARCEWCSCGWLNGRVCRLHDSCMAFQGHILDLWKLPKEGSQHGCLIMSPSTKHLAGLFWWGGMHRWFGETRWSIPLKRFE